MKEFSFHSEILEEIYAQAFSHAPSEACGWVIKNADGNLQYFPAENLQDKYHAIDPEQYPRTSKEAFMMNTKKLSEAIAQAQAAGASLYSIVHSHVDVGAYFSAEDRLQMTSADGETAVYPAENFLVVAVKNNQRDGEAVFYFDLDQKEFQQGKIVY